MLLQSHLQSSLAHSSIYLADYQQKREAVVGDYRQAREVVVSLPLGAPS